MKFPFVFRSTYEQLERKTIHLSTMVSDLNATNIYNSEKINSMRAEDHARKQIISNLNDEIEHIKKKMLVRGNYEMARSLYYLIRRMMSDKNESPEAMFEIFRMSGFHKLGSETRQYIYQGINEILYGKNNTRNKEEA